MLLAPLLATLGATVDIGGQGDAKLRFHDAADFSTVLSTIESTSATPLSFTTSSTPRMIITASGKIGIGTSLPEKELHVVGTGSVANADEIVRVIDESSNMTLSLGSDSTASFIQSTIPGSGYQKLLLNPHNGQVGIGTTDQSKVFANGTRGVEPCLVPWRCALEGRDTSDLLVGPNAFATQGSPSGEKQGPPSRSPTRQEAQLF